MGCTQAEILRLLELIEDEVFVRSKSLEEAKRAWNEIKNRIRDMSLAELKAMLGLL
jgi:uncharacterized protein (DUF1919 family)